jgi:hypothetical protein
MPANSPSKSALPRAKARISASASLSPSSGQPLKGVNLAATALMSAKISLSRGRSLMVGMLDRGSDVASRDQTNSIAWIMRTGNGLSKPEFAPPHH